MTNNIKKFLRVATLPLVAVVTLVTSLWPQDTYAFTFPAGWVSSYSTSDVYYRLGIVGEGFNNYRTGNYVDFVTAKFIEQVQFYDTFGEDLTIPANSIWSISFVAENCSFEGITSILHNDLDYARFLGFDVQSTGYEYVTYYFYNNLDTSYNSRIDVPVSVNCQNNSRFKATTFSSFIKFDPSSGQVDYSSALEDLRRTLEDIDANIDNHFFNVEDGVAGTADAVDRQTQIIEEQQSSVENAQSDAVVNSDDSSSSATAMGTSLLGVFSSFVNALTHVSPKNNCYITVDLGHINFGRLDLCESSPPPEFQVISSLIVIGFSVPVSLMLVNKMISLFRGFA